MIKVYFITPFLSYLFAELVSSALCLTRRFVVNVVFDLIMIVTPNVSISTKQQIEVQEQGMENLE